MTTMNSESYKIRILYLRLSIKKSLKLICVLELKGKGRSFSQTVINNRFTK